MDLSTVDSTWKGHEYFTDWLVKELNPKVTVEIGTYKGFSTYWLAHSNKGDVYTIDIHDYGFDEKDFTNVTKILDKSMDVLKGWNKPIDLLHIDGSHDAKEVSEDLTKWMVWMNPHGVILVHDVLNLVHPGPFNAFMMLEAFDKNNANIKKLMFLPNQGLGILTMNYELYDKILDKYRGTVVTDTTVATLLNFYKVSLERAAAGYRK